jgi:hypothetical protein
MTPQLAEKVIYCVLAGGSEGERGREGGGEI